MTDEAPAKKSNAGNFLKPCKACGKLIHCRAKSCGHCHCVDPVEKDGGVPTPNAPGAQAPNVVPIRHAPTSPDSVFIVARAYRTTINGTTVAYEKGRIIDNADLARILIAGGAPVEEHKRADLIECPYCQKMFGNAREAKAQKA